MPSPFSDTYLPAHGRSVAALRRTSYWSGSSRARHSCSLLTTFSVFSMSLLSDCVTDTLRGPRGRVAPSGPPATVLDGDGARAPRPNPRRLFSVGRPHRGPYSLSVH